MKYKWLNKNNNSIILFFNGWGMDEEVVKHLDCKDYDVVMFYDYNSLETDFNFQGLKQYGEVNLIAWSMGVMIGSVFADKIPHLETSTAINGTLEPIHSEFGIHPKIYDLTIRGFNEKGREKFVSGMFDTDIKIVLNRDLENQKSELSALKNYSANKNFVYKKFLISDNDKIIPTKNQCKFWKAEPNLTGGHCPFLQFKNWSELL